MGVSPSAFEISNCTTQNTTEIIVVTPENVTEVLYTPLEDVIIRYVMPGMLCVCLLGNFGFFFTVLRVKRMWTTTNLYLVNLSIADICFLSMIVGEKSWRYYAVGIPSYGEVLGTWGCAIIYMGVYTPYFTSIMIVTLVSVERYFAICMPLKHMVIWSKKRTVTVVTASWFVAMFLSATVLPGYTNLTIRCLIWPDTGEYDGYPNVAGHCGAFGTGSLAYENFAQTVPFFVAIIANTVFYARIILKMKERAQSSRENTSSVVGRTKLLQARNQVARMLVVNGTVFFCCQAPFEFGCFVFFVQTVIYDTSYKHTEDFILSNEQYRTFLWIARLLVYANSMVNPLVFNSTSPRYRKAFLAAFTRHPNKIKKPPYVLDDCQSSDATCKTSL